MNFKVTPPSDQLSITSYFDEDIYTFYNDVDETLGKSTHFTIVMADCNAQIRREKKPMETATDKVGHGL